MTIRAKVQMWGNTRAVRIPKALAAEMGLESGTEVSLSTCEDGLLLKPVRARKRFKLADLLAQCKIRNPHKEMITGRAGKELF